MKILLRAVDRIEGIVVPNVPTNRQQRLGGLDCFVDRGVGLAKAVGPEHLPGGQFGISQEKPPELHVVAVDRPFAAPRRANKFFELEKSLLSALRIDAALFCLLLTKLAKAGDLVRIDRGRVVRGSQAVAKGTLSFRAPHDAV